MRARGLKTGIEIDSALPRFRLGTAAYALVILVFEGATELARISALDHRPTRIPLAAGKHELRFVISTGFRQLQAIEIAIDLSDDPIARIQLVPGRGRRITKRALPATLAVTYG